MNARARECSETVLACGYTVEEITYFWSLVARGSRDECWMWMGYINNHLRDDGRAYVNFQKGRRLGSRVAARVAWETMRGPISDGLYVCHSCDRGWCVNFHHFFLGTAKDNVHDSISKGRFSQWARTGFKLNGERVMSIHKTQCKHGHELCGANVRMNSIGHRVCVACDSRRTTAYRLRQRDAIGASAC